MIEIGRLCIKIAGRDAGMRCVIVEAIDDKFVIIDGETRRRKCNVCHLEALEQSIELKKGASHDDVAAAFKKLKIPVWQSKPKQAAKKPVKERASEKKAKEEQPKKKAKKKKPVEKKQKKKAEPKKAAKEKAKK